MRAEMVAVLLVVAGIPSNENVHAQDTNDSATSLTQDEESVQKSLATERQREWDAIQESAEAYVTAYNSGDAEAIAKLYCEDAELVDAAGTSYRGRGAITAEYAAFFEEHPEATLKVVVENLTFVSPTVAIEDGQTVSSLGKDQPQSFSRYVAVHVKEEDQWRLASVRDEELPAEPGEQLEDLSWLIGRWVDEAPESLMVIDCYWHESGSYLIRDFEIKIEGLLASSGTERIGWDPLKQQVRSWLFDSDGGVLEATWVHKGGQWTATAQGFSADGEPIHARYVMSPLRKDAYHMHAIHRTVGQQELEDFDMTIVRHSPAPGDVPQVESPADETSGSKDEQE